MQLGTNEYIATFSMQHLPNREKEGFNFESVWEMCICYGVVFHSEGGRNNTATSVVPGRKSQNAGGLGQLPIAVL